MENPIRWNGQLVTHISNENVRIRCEAYWIRAAPANAHDAISQKYLSTHCRSSELEMTLLNLIFHAPAITNDNHEVHFTIGSLRPASMGYFLRHYCDETDDLQQYDADLAQHHIFGRKQR